MSKSVYSEKYEVQELIAQGGMGMVYKALDRKLNRIVALKVVHPHLSGDASFLGRFLREARSMAQLQHDNIVSIYAVEQDDDLQYLVMEYFPGRNLRDELTERGSLPLLEAVNITRQLANALSYAHSRDIVHRDIKPANVLLGNKLKAKLTDFGIAAALNETPLTSTGQLIGTLQYMSPEQARDATLDGRSDLFSLGLLFYEMLCGFNPRKQFSNSAILTMLASGKTDELTFPPHIPEGIRLVVSDLIRYRPEDRITDADTLLERLETLRPVWNIARSATQDSSEPTIVVSPRRDIIADERTIADLSRSPSVPPVPTPPPQQPTIVYKFAVACSIAIGIAVVGYGSWYLYDRFTDNSQMSEQDRRDSKVVDNQQTERTPDAQKVSQRQPEAAVEADTDRRSNDEKGATRLRQAAAEAEADKEAAKTVAAQNALEKKAQAAKAEAGRQEAQRRDAAQKKLERQPEIGKKAAADRKKDQEKEAERQRQLPVQAQADKEATRKDTEQKIGQTAKAEADRRKVAQRKEAEQKGVEGPQQMVAKAQADKEIGRPTEQRQAEQKSQPAKAAAPSPEASGTVTDESSAIVARAAKPDAELLQILDGLRQSIMDKDLSKVEQMSDMTDNRKNMLSELFRNYSSIKVEEISARDVVPTPTGAKVVLQFTDLISMAGEKQTLPPPVRKVQLAVNKNGPTWGQIIWDPHLR